MFRPAIHNLFVNKLFINNQHNVLFTNNPSISARCTNNKLFNNLFVPAVFVVANKKMIFKTPPDLGVFLF
jgi:hypothetical protein